MSEDFFNGFFQFLIIGPIIFALPFGVINAITDGKFWPYGIAIRILVSIGNGYYNMKKEEERRMKIKREEKIAREEREKIAKSRK